MRGVRHMSLLVAAALLGACAAREAREPPHHYSTARDGSPTACYATPVANEYECLPMRPAYASPYYDPFWQPYGSPYYAWTWPPYDPGHAYAYPVYVPAPPPPPHHFRPRRP